MLVIVAILLVFGAVVRYKWRNAAAEKEEILRLVARVSEEEAEIEKLQAVEEYNSPFSPVAAPPPPTPPPSQIEKPHYCAVCYCPTTTRCSKCKAVRYCSGKCQIIHWRQGHKNDCRPATPIHGSKENKSVDETGRDNQINKHLNEPKGSSDPLHEVDDSGSSSCSVPFPSSPEQSETSFDASLTEDRGSGTPISVRPDEVVSNSHLSQTTCDSDEADVPSLDSNAHKESLFEANKYKIASPAEPVEGFQRTGFKDKIAGDGTDRKEEFALGKVDSKGSQPSRLHKSSSPAGHHKNLSQPPGDKAMEFKDFNKSVNNHQVPNVVLGNSQCSKSLSTSSEEYWKKEAQLCYSKETRSMSFRNSGNDKSSYAKSGSLQNSFSEVEYTQMMHQPPSKGLKTSVLKIVQHFRGSKHSKSYTIDIGKDSMGNCTRKVIFPPKLFIQLYSYHDLELHPFGLMNSGNSCFANAVLQCLTFTPPITSYFLQGLHSKSCHKKGWCLICEFECLIRKGQEMRSSVSPDGILFQIQRIGNHLCHGREEDAHDFLRNMVDTMQCIWLEEAGASGSLAEDSTLLGLSFGGYIQSKIKCMKCSGRSEQCERMMDLTVEIDGDIDTLEGALSRFTISETLSGNDKYKCNRCKSYEKAKKKLTILEAPNVLTIVLKRFRSGNLEKLNKLVQFPDTLNLSRYVSGKGDKYPFYHLYAVVVHSNMMNAAYSGHYISYVKNLHGLWFRIDDSRVSPVDQATVLSAEAYILFYARHTPRIPSLVANNVLSDGKPKRITEAIPTTNVTKKKTPKPKPAPSNWIPPNNFTVHSEDWGYHPARVADWSSDTSSIFSTSDAGSCSTDSTKDSSVDEISGYIFGTSMYH